MNREKRTVWLAALAVAALAVWIHLPCIQNQFLDWDDDIYLDALARHHPFWALTPFYFHPLTWLSHALDCRLWELRPTGHHLTSVLLHGANSALVLWLAWMLLESVRERFALAVGVAVVFAIHPLQVESVAWIAERKNVLCGFFFLASLCAYARGRRGLALALGLAALLSKPMAVSLPVAMLAMDFYPLRRHVTVGWRRLVAEKWVLILGCVALALGTFIPQVETEAVRNLVTMSLGDRFFVAVRGLVFYLWKLVWPAWLCPYYPLGEVRPVQAEFLVPLAVVTAVTTVAVLSRKSAPAILAAWVAYIGLILPVSGLVQSGAQAAADRFMYLAMLPLLLLVAGGCAWLWRRANGAVKVALIVLVAGEMVFFGLRTREQITVWRDKETLWQAVLARFPLSGQANLHEAMILNEQFRFAEAVPHALQAVRVVPDDPLPHAVLGLAYLKTRKYPEAANELQQAAQQDPELFATRYNLACAYTRLGQFPEAFGTLEKLLRDAPQFAPAAARDAELNALRQHPEFGPRLPAP